MGLSNYIIRPLRANDLDQLESLISSSMTGLTSLPKDRHLLDRLIQHSEASFKKTLSAPENESYFFGLEDVNTGTLEGVSGIFSKIGIKFPFYSFKLMTIKKVSKSLQKERVFKLLKLLTVKDGPSEIGGLYLNPERRGGGIGKFLSLSRFLFIAQWRQRFDKKIIAEMRGVSSKTGQSPFWDCVGKTFFDMSFKEADLLTVKNRAFIDELVPRYPIYVHLLPQEAQDVIGKPHIHTEPAVKLLKRQGFKQLSHVDIFDGGPKLSCLTDHIKLVKSARQVVVVSGKKDALEFQKNAPANSPSDHGHEPSQTSFSNNAQGSSNKTQQFMVANADLLNYRVRVCEAELNGDVIRLKDEDAAYLGVSQSSDGQHTTGQFPDAQHTTGKVSGESSAQKSGNHKVYICPF